MPRFVCVFGQPLIRWKTVSETCAAPADEALGRVRLNTVGSPLPVAVTPEPPPIFLDTNLG